MNGIEIRVTQADRLAVLLDALGEVPMSAGERASLVWLAGQELPTVENIAGVISRARGVCLWCTTSPAPHVVWGDPVCEGCYRDHRSEVTR